MTKGSVSSRVFAFLAGSLSLEELEKWTVGHIQAAQDSGDEELLELFDALDGAIMEYRDGLVDQPEFVRELEAILSRAETLDLTPDDFQGLQSIEVDPSPEAAATVVYSPSPPPKSA